MRGNGRIITNNSKKMASQSLHNISIAVEKAMAMKKEITPNPSQMALKMYISKAWRMLMNGGGKMEYDATCTSTQRAAALIIFFAAMFLRSTGVDNVDYFLKNVARSIRR